MPNWYSYQWRKRAFDVCVPLCPPPLNREPAALQQTYFIMPGEKTPIRTKRGTTLME